MNTEKLNPVRLRFLVTLFLLVATLFLFNKFVSFVELRPGVVLDDQVLALIPPIDFTYPIFFFIYGAMIFSFLILRKAPSQLLLCLQAYVLIVAIRTIAMYCLPLDPPSGMILLRDPIVELAGESKRVLTRDLFFSGHTALLFLFTLFMPNRRAKALMFTVTVGVAAMLLAQHVHYTIDVLAAFFFTYGAFRICTKMARVSTCTQC